MKILIGWIEFLSRPIGLVVFAAAMLLGMIGITLWQGPVEFRRVLNERSGIEFGQDLSLSNVGPFIDETGVPVKRSRLWCGWMPDQPDRRVAAVEVMRRWRGRDLLGTALSWAPRSDLERRMLAQCARITHDPALITPGAA